MMVLGSHERLEGQAPGIGPGAADSGRRVPLGRRQRAGHDHQGRPSKATGRAKGISSSKPSSPPDAGEVDAVVVGDAVAERDAAGIF